MAFENNFLRSQTERIEWQVDYLWRTFVSPGFSPEPFQPSGHCLRPFPKEGFQIQNQPGRPRAELFAYIQEFLRRRIKWEPVMIARIKVEKHCTAKAIILLMVKDRERASYGAWNQLMEQLGESSGIENQPPRSHMEVGKRNTQSCLILCFSPYEVSTCGK